MGQHYWMMSPAEQAALVFLLEHLRPKAARAGLSFAFADGDHAAEALLPTERGTAVIRCDRACLSGMHQWAQISEASGCERLIT